MGGGARGWQEAALAAGVAAAALLAQLGIFARGVVPVDEGQLVTIADRLLRGEVLYRDVYTGLFPGIYYATALLFGLFGEDVVVTRWAQACVNAATAAALWQLGRRVVTGAWAGVAPVLYVGLVALGFPGLTMLNYSPLALVLALYALVFGLRYLESARVTDAVLTGLLLGGCGLVKQNFGGLAVAAVVAGLLLGRRGSPLSRRPWAGALLPVLASGAAVALLAGAALAGAGALPAFVDATLVSIGRSQLEAFADPLPPLLGAHPADDGRFVFVYTPAALFGYLMRGETLFGLPMSGLLRSAAIRLAYGGALATLAAGLGVLWADRRRRAPARRRASCAVVIFSVLMFLGIFPSAIWSHLAFVLAPVLLVFALVGDRVAGALAVRSAPAAAAWKGLYVVLLVGALALLVQISADVRRWHPEPLGVARASLYVSTGQRSLLRGATRFLERCAAPEEPVFVAPDLPLLYFLSGRRNPTPYDLVIPGEVRGDVIVRRLRQTATRCVVYNPRMYLQFAPFPELFPEVAHHLEGSYRRAEVISGQGAEWYGLVLRPERGP
jgi:hypothetical protein